MSTSSFLYLTDVLGMFCYFQLLFPEQDFLIFCLLFNAFRQDSLSEDFFFRYSSTLLTFYPRYLLLIQYCLFSLSLVGWTSFKYLEYTLMLNC